MCVCSVLFLLFSCFALCTLCFVSFFVLCMLFLFFWLVDHVSVYLPVKKNKKKYCSHVKAIVFKMCNAEDQVLSCFLPVCTGLISLTAFTVLDALGICRGVHQDQQHSNIHRNTVINHFRYVFLEAFLIPVA